MEPAHKPLTVEEVLDPCPTDQRHYQLFDGVMVAVAPPATPHQIIAARLGGEIYASLGFLRAPVGIAPIGLGVSPDPRLAGVPLCRDRAGRRDRVSPGARPVDDHCARCPRGSAARQYWGGPGRQGEYRETLNSGSRGVESVTKFLVQSNTWNQFSLRRGAGRLFGRAGRNFAAE